MKHIVFRQFFRDFCSAAIYPAVFLLSVALLILLSAGCSREDEVRGGKVGSGDYITFTATGGGPSATTKSSAVSSGEVEQSYTIYYDFEKGENVSAPQSGLSYDSAGNLTQSSDTKFAGDVFEITTGSGVYAEYIDWVAGDKITIAQQGDAGANLSSDYIVGTPTRKGNRSTAPLTPVTGNGLQWREGQANRFVALYPSAADLGLTVKETPSIYQGSDYFAYFERASKDYMPSTQYCTLDGTGTRTTETWYAPDMKYAYMLASADVPVSSIGDPLSLEFYPQFSSVEVKLLKPSSLSEATVKLKSAVLTGGTGSATATSLSGNPRMTRKNVTSIMPGSVDVIIVGGDPSDDGNSITMGFKKSDDTTDDSPVLEDAGISGSKPVSFTFLMMPDINLTQLELTLTLDITTTSGVTKTETKTLKLKDANGWIPLPAGKKLTISNMKTWTVDIVAPSAFTERVFTVSSDGLKVKFSSGNLQAVIAEGHDDSAEGARWQFADRQYQYPSRATGDAYSAAAGETVDLFMHPESGDVTTDPYAFGIPLPVNGLYSPTTTTFADWGQYCDIYPNSTSLTPYAKNTYRTPTAEEWDYLLKTRPSGATVGSTTPNDARYSLINLNVGGTTGTILGMLIYPDGFTWTSAMGTAPNVNSATVPTVPYTLAQFEAMESAGVVFLPAAGFCSSNSSSGGFGGVGSTGVYWSAGWSRSFLNNGYSLQFTSGLMTTPVGSTRDFVFSVRLVRDIDDFRVSDGQKVKFSPGNLQAVIKTANSAANARWQFADNQYDYPSRGEGGSYSAAAGTTVDLFMHPESATGPHALGIPWSSSYSPTTTNFANWGQYCDIYPNSDPTSTPYPANTYRTLTIDEWDYLLNTRASGATVDGTSDARYSLITLNVGGTTGTILGLLIYPDGFTWNTTTMGTAPDVNSPGSGSGSVLISPNVYTLAEFEAMESEGIVFLPAAGRCNSDGKFDYLTDTSITVAGFYWSASIYSSNSRHARHLLFHKSTVSVLTTLNARFCGFSVRLVKNVK